MQSIRGMIVLVTLLLVTGCGRQQGPLLVHGQPVSYWLEELRKPDAKARKKAVAKLGNVGKADPAAIPAVIGALKDHDAVVREAAVLALFNLGPDAAEGADALAATAKQDSNAAVRAHAAKALARIQSAS